MKANNRERNEGEGKLSAIQPDYDLSRGELNAQRSLASTNKILVRHRSRGEFNKFKYC